MTATITKLSSALSSSQMGSLLATHAGKIYAQPHAKGVEVRDFRPIIERVANPITGRGVIYYFGETHMVISAALATKWNLAA